MLITFLRNSTYRYDLTAVARHVGIDSPGTLRSQKLAGPARARSRSAGCLCLEPGPGDRHSQVLDRIGATGSIMLHRMVSPLSPCTTTQRPTSIISHLAAIDRRITLRAQRSTATNTPSIRTHNNDNLVVPSCADPCFRPRCSSTRHSAEPCRHEDAILHAAAAAHAPPGPHLLGDIPQQRDHIVVHLPLLRVSQDLVCAVGPLELIRRLCCRLRVSLLVGVVSELGLGLGLGLGWRLGGL